MSYHEATRALYREAALKPQPTLCCAAGSPFRLPGLDIPSEMQAMNYGCGTTVHLQDLSPGLDILYLGVGGGLEALQFAYFTRRPGSVMALDPVPEMREKARANLRLAERTNPWFRSIERLARPETMRVPAGTFSTDVYLVQTSGRREGRFHIERAYPHRVVPWEWKDAAKGQVGWLGGTDSGELTGSERLEYWKVHDRGDEKYLERLGLEPVVK